MNVSSSRTVIKGFVCFPDLIILTSKFGYHNNNFHQNQEKSHGLLRVIIISDGMTGISITGNMYKGLVFRKIISYFPYGIRIESGPETL
jgi:hypothetical protein